MAAALLVELAKTHKRTTAATRCWMLQRGYYQRKGVRSACNVNWSYHYCTLLKIIVGVPIDHLPWLLLLARTLCVIIAACVIKLGILVLYFKSNLLLLHATNFIQKYIDISAIN